MATYQLLTRLPAIRRSIRSSFEAPSPHQAKNDTALDRYKEMKNTPVSRNVFDTAIRKLILEFYPVRPSKLIELMSGANLLFASLVSPQRRLPLLVVVVVSLYVWVVVGPERDALNSSKRISGEPRRGVLLWVSVCSLSKLEPRLVTRPWLVGACLCCNFCRCSVPSHCDYT